MLFEASFRQHIRKYLFLQRFFSQTLPFKKRKLPQDRPKRLVECFLKFLFAKIVGNICFFNAFSSKLFLQSVFFKAFLLSSKPSFQSSSSKPPLSKPLAQSAPLKAPSLKAFLSKRLPQSLFFKALSSKRSPQALSFKTLRSKPLPSLQSVSPKAFSSKLLFTSLCNILSKTLFADLDILCSKQVRDTRQTIRQKCLHFDGNMIGIRKFVALRQLQ